MSSQAGAVTSPSTGNQAMLAAQYDFGLPGQGRMTTEGHPFGRRAIGGNKVLKSRMGSGRRIPCDRADKL
jgi:hypothetical protein